VGRLLIRRVPQFDCPDHMLTSPPRYRHGTPARHGALLNPFTTLSCHGSQNLAVFVGCIGAVMGYSDSASGIQGVYSAAISSGIGLAAPLWMGAG